MSLKFAHQLSITHRTTARFCYSMPPLWWMIHLPEKLSFDLNFHSYSRWNFSIHIEHIIFSDWNKISLYTFSTHRNCFFIAHRHTHTEKESAGERADTRRRKKEKIGKISHSSAALNTRVELNIFFLFFSFHIFFYFPPDIFLHFHCTRLNSVHEFMYRLLIHLSTEEFII